MSRPYNREEMKEMYRLLERAIAEERGSSSRFSNNDGSLPDLEEFEADLKYLLNLGNQLKQVSQEVGKIANRHDNGERETGLAPIARAGEQFLLLLGGAFSSNTKSSFALMYLESMILGLHEDNKHPMGWYNERLLEFQQGRGPEMFSRFAEKAFLMLKSAAREREAVPEKKGG